MNPFSYTHRLQEDIARWVELGWLSEAGRDAIVDDLDRRQKRHRPFAITLGAGLVLVLAGVIAFVSSNWDGLRYGMRLLILLGGMAFLYAAALAAMHLGSRRWIPESLFLLAAGLFGANVFLIAQMYHISSDAVSGAIMLWCAGCLVTAWGARSPVTLNLVFVTLFLWTHLRLTEFVRLEPWLDSGFLVFPMLWSAAVVTAARWKWNPLPHHALATLIYFLHHLGQSIGYAALDERTAFFTAVCLVIFVAVRAATTARVPWLAGRLPVMERYALGAALLGFALLYAHTSQGHNTGEFADAADWALLTGGSVGAVSVVFLYARGHLRGRDAAALVVLLAGTVSQPYLSDVDQDPLRFWAHAAFALMLVLWLIEFGLSGDPFWRVPGYVLFAALLTHVYTRAFGSLLETSLYLILGGLILLAAAVVLRRFDRWAAAKMGDRPA